MIFVDFDDVIFHTKKFIQDEKRIFARHGFSEEIFKKHYYSYRKKGKRKWGFYDLKKQILGIKEELGMNVSSLEQELEFFLNDTSNYIFSDVEFFLKKFEKRELYLLSYSKTNFQKLKIKNSGIAKYFKKIIVTDDKKSKAILEIIKKKKNWKKEKTYFLDDRIEYLKDVKNKISHIKTIFIKRKEGRYKDDKTKDCDFAVKNLDEALKIINPV